jgi:ubiquinone/menaquinone biosynthesis C-methylase UbiE
VRVADLEAPLSFLPDASFDVVLSPLVLEYVRDWRAAFAEFRRVLVTGGCLVVSVTHPFFDSTYFATQKYFETELVHTEWRGFGPSVRMPTYRRSLEETLNPFVETGFLIERVLEPRPTADFAAADPRHYEELMRKPCFLCIRAMSPRPASG